MSNSLTEPIRFIYTIEILIRVQKRRARSRYFTPSDDAMRNHPSALDLNVSIAMANLAESRTSPPKET